MKLVYLTDIFIWLHVDGVHLAPQMSCRNFIMLYHHSNGHSPYSFSGAIAILLSITLLSGGKTPMSH